MDKGTLMDIITLLRQLAYEVDQKEAYYIHRIADMLDREVEDYDNNNRS